MCQRLILLGENDFQQKILACEHGIIHLSLGYTTLYLKWADFIQFVNWVEQHLLEVTPSKQWKVRESEAGEMELWLGNGGVRMNVLEFVAFTSLLKASLQQLEVLSLDDLLTPDHSASPISWN